MGKPENPMVKPPGAATAPASSKGVLTGADVSMDEKVSRRGSDAKQGNSETFFLNEKMVI